MEKENREKKAEVPYEDNLNILRDKIVELEQKNRELDMEIILGEEKEKKYQDNIN